MRCRLERLQLGLRGISGAPVFGKLFKTVGFPLKNVWGRELE